MDNKELMIAYKVICEMMKENKRASYNNSFVTVKNCLANKICEKLEDSQNFNNE